MPSLRTLDVVHRLNAPTRAAAARRRRLRKAAAIACIVCAAVVIMPDGRDTGRASASSTGHVADDRGVPSSASLSGRHALTMRPMTPVGADAQRVDIWTGSGVRLVRCVPTLAAHAQAGAASRLTDVQAGGAAQDATVTVALTDAELTSVTRHLGPEDGSPQGLIVSACL